MSRLIGKEFVKNKDTRIKKKCICGKQRIYWNCPHCNENYWLCPNCGKADK